MPEILELTRKDAALLEEIYNGLYLETFTKEAELEALDDWQKRLGKHKGKKPQQHFYVMKDKGNVIAFVVTEFYPQSKTMLVNYAVKNKDTGHSAKPLIEHATNAHKTNMIFWEGHNPPPQSYGYQPVNIDYIQGDINGSGEAHGLTLYAKGGNGKDLKNFLQEFNKHFNNNISLNNFVGELMMSQVEEIIKGERELFKTDGF